MCPGYGPDGRPRSPQVRRHLPQATRPGQTGWLPGPKRFAAVAAEHAARLARTPSWAWRLDLHSPGCRYAAACRRLGLAR